MCLRDLNISFYTFAFIHCLENYFERIGFGEVVKCTGHSCKTGTLDGVCPFDGAYWNVGRLTENNLLFQGDFLDVSRIKTQLGFITFFGSAVADSRGASGNFMVHTEIDDPLHDLREFL